MFGFSMDDSSDDDDWDPVTEIPVEDWPWISAIVRPECLDWKKGRTEAEIQTILDVQLELPVLISSPESNINVSVYLSDAKHARLVKLLESHKITHVLNVAGEVAQGDAKEYEAAGIHLRTISAEDEEGYPMLQRHLDETQEFIQEAPSGSKIVIHCVAGLNRSGVLVAAHHLLSSRLNVLEVVAHLRKQRGNMALCNSSFATQLVGLARKKDLLGPKPGDPGCIVKEAAPPLATYLSNCSGKKSIKSLF